MPPDVQAVISTASSVVALLTQAANLFDSQGDKAKSKEFLDLLERYLSLITEDAELKIANLNLKEEVKNLKQAIIDRNNYEFKDNVYWKRVDGSGPYCSRCFDAENKIVNMHKSHRRPNNVECPNCKDYVQYIQSEDEEPMQLKSSITMSDYK